MLRPVFLGATIITLPIAVVVGESVMMLAYFGFFLPLATAFRLAKRDALRLKCDREASSYWQVKPERHDVSSYYRQS